MIGTAPLYDKEILIFMEDNKLVEGKDFYKDEDGRMVFTADYLLRRGYCCESGCRHCPYGGEDSY